jgi:hypothetical protein
MIRDLTLPRAPWILFIVAHAELSPGKFNQIALISIDINVVEIK